LPAQAELVLGEGGCAGWGAGACREAGGGGEGIHGHKGPGNDERGDSAQHLLCLGDTLRVKELAYV